MVDLASHTAQDLTSEDLKSYRPAQAIAQRRLNVQPQLARRLKQAMRFARNAALLLRRDFGASRVVLFGSLASQDNFSLWSDVDLAAWGIPEEQFFAAVAAVTGISQEFKVDLVDANDCKESLRTAIEQNGIDL